MQIVPFQEKPKNTAWLVVFLSCMVATMLISFVALFALSQTNVIIKQEQFLHSDNLELIELAQKNPKNTCIGKVVAVEKHSDADMWRIKYTASLSTGTFVDETPYVYNAEQISHYAPRTEIKIAYSFVSSNNVISVPLSYVFVELDNNVEYAIACYHRKIDILLLFSAIGVLIVGAMLYCFVTNEYFFKEEIENA